MISGPDLVNLAMEMTGATTDTELARHLGLTSFSAPRNVKRWREGVNDPDFEATLLLLGAAGLLREEASPPKASASAEAVTALDRRLDVDVIPRLDAIANELRNLTTERGRVG